MSSLNRDTEHTGFDLDLLVTSAGFRSSPSHSHYNDVTRRENVTDGRTRRLADTPLRGEPVGGRVARVMSHSCELTVSAQPFQFVSSRARHHLPPSMHDACGIRGTSSRKRERAGPTIERATNAFHPGERRAAICTHHTHMIRPAGSNEPTRELL